MNVTVVVRKFTHYANRSSEILIIDRRHQMASQIN